VGSPRCGSDGSTRELVTIRKKASVALALAFVIALFGLGAGAIAVGSGGTDRVDRRDFEVWAIDQSDSAPGYGGTLHIFDGRELEASPASAVPESIDLGKKASDLCLEKTGAYPVRPHMLVFNGAERLEDSTDAVIAFVVSGHILFMDTEKREPLDCVQMSRGEKEQAQAHAAWPTPDQKHLIVANQNGKLLQRISTDYANDRFELDPNATLSLYEGVTPTGEPKEGPGRPDNAPICPRTTEDGRFTFVTLRGGGMFVFDHNESPMRIVAEYDNAHVDDNGCGEFEANGKMYVNSGAGAPGDPFGHNVYSFDLDSFSSRLNRPNTPTPKLVYTREGEVDAHAVSNSKGGDRYLWWGDRSKNDVTVLDTRDDEIVNRFSLVEPFATDPAPDLFDLAPDAKYMFASLRGPQPLSGGHDAVGNTPGVGVIDVRRGGKDGRLVGVAATPPRLDQKLPPDPHAIRVRKGGGR
jgi:hypothetical protein